MRLELSKIIDQIHEIQMKLEILQIEEEIPLKKVIIKDGEWSQGANWKLSKAIESIFNAKKSLNLVLDALPKERKRK